MRYLLIALAVLVSVFGAMAEGSWPPDEEIAEAVERNLLRHYDSARLRTWMDDAAPEARKAMEYLLAWMPSSDLGSWSAPMLVENVELALTARRPGTDDFTFHAFVLPHRVSQEPASPWRPRLRDLLKDRVAGLSDNEAALEVNRFCREWATFKSSSRRDQPPLLTMERGIGRCEEETILLVCALRSVGLPARQCYTPFWTTGDNNHAWVEVLGEDGWHYLGACEPNACLDQAWFTRTARRAGLVLSIGYGEAPVPPELEGFLYRQSSGSTVLNSCDVYTEAGWLTVSAPGDELEDEAPWAWVHVFNYGAPMVLGRTRIGEPLALGPGDFLVTAEIAGRPWSGLASIEPGGETELHLKPELYFLDAPVWLRYPDPGENVSGGCKAGKDDPAWIAHRKRLTGRDDERARRSEISRAWMKLVGEHPEGEALLAKLEEAGAAQADWAEAVLALCCEHQSLALDLTLQMDVKDFYEMDPGALEDIIDEVLPIAESSTLPDSLFFEFVLSPRILFQSGTMDWWTQLPRFEDPSPEALLAQFRDQVQKAENTRGGHVATPAQTWRSGWSDLSSARVCLAGLLRHHGVPARVERGLQGVDYWEDGQWRTLRPFPLDEDESEVASMPEAYLAVEYYASGARFEKIETWRQTRLTRFTEGHFEPWYTGQISEGDAQVDWELPAGDWWLFAGQRNGQGEPRFISHPFTIAVGDSLRFSMDFGIPLDELERADLVRREWDRSERLILKRRGQSRSLRRLSQAKPLLIVLGLNHHEPTMRHLEALGDLENLSVLPVQIRRQEGHMPSKETWTISLSEAKKLFGVKNPEQQLPLSILLDTDGETLLWLPGMRLNLAGHLALMK
jgi:hypothetical protein